MKAIRTVMDDGGIVKDVCPHGFAHPSRKFRRRNMRLSEGFGLIHGCDGCCL